MTPAPLTRAEQQPEPLRQELARLLAETARPDIEGDLLALIVPGPSDGSGGRAAAEAYKLLEGADFDVVIAVAPSETGSFQRIAIAREDFYPSPLGAVPVHDGLRNELCDEDDDIFLDDRGHYSPGGISSELPFLQVALPGPFSVVPIVMGDDSPAFCRELGAAIGEVMYGRRALLVASADLDGMDDGALERFVEAFEAFDTSEMMHLLASEALRISGSGPLLVAALAARHRGANRARVLHALPPGEGRPGGALVCALWRG